MFSTSGEPVGYFSGTNSPDGTPISYTSIDLQVESLSDGGFDLEMTYDQLKEPE